jgi:GAF domain-containing protein
VADLAQELRDARAREAATGEILRVINRSPTDYQPVFEAILENATRLCDAPLAVLFMRRHNGFHLVAHAGTRPEFVEFLLANPLPLDPEKSITAKAAAERRAIEIPDISDEQSHGAGHPLRRSGVEVEGIRTQLTVPMLRGDEAVGVIIVYRREVRSFERNHVELLTTFTEQAAIAVDNVRRFRALQESLERQTATGEILSVISRSPTDYQPVFETVLENATRLCDAPLAVLFMRGDDAYHLVAHKGSRPEYVEFLRARPLPLDPKLSGIAQAGAARRPSQMADVTDSAAYREGQSVRVASVDIEGIRSALWVPMVKHDETIGVICLYRREVRPFDESHVDLVSTFASQAVIAVDNVRLFQALEARTDELGEALERQTATSDILRVISRSPTDYQPVFETILENATRLCDAPLAVLLMRREDGYHLVAHAGSRPEYIEFMRANPLPLDPAASVTAQTGIDRRPVQIADVTDHPIYRDGQPYRSAVVDIEGIRSGLWVPMVKNDETVGVLCLYRREVRPFDQGVVDLVSTFADQAVIAIDNVRLFQALEARTDELGEALERQTATSDILRTISRSPTDYGPVFDAILDSATRLCDAPLAFLLMREGDYFNLVAHRGSRPEFVEWTLENPVPIDSPLLAARAAVEGVPQQLADITDSKDYRDGLPHRVASADIEGIRSGLFVPMMKGDDCVGVIAVYRREVRPFDDSHVALVSTFADQAVIAIDNVRLFQALADRTHELARSVGELRALGEIGQAVNSTLEPETVLTTIINQAVALTGTDGGLISEYDEATGTLPARAAPGMAALVEGQDPVRLGEGAIGRAAETRAPVQIPDIDAPGAYAGRLRVLLDRAGLKALLAVPLLREDRVLGALLVARKTPGEFPPGTVELLGTFAAQSALAIHNARLFRELEEKGRELAQANQHKSEFLANMSHELRTPLNAVIGFSEVLGEEMFGELNEKQSEYVEDIHSSGRHLLSLINDILDLSKIEAGRMDLDFTTFDVQQALDNALTLVSERAGRRGIALDSEIDESLGDMTGDERKVKQILLNLLSNAIKFTPEGGRVALTARGADSTVVIAVRDTGVGISAEDQEHIFEEFRQVGTDYARKIEGTGLGLTLTRRFVELHGGDIVVESEPGAGSEFRITLPLEPPETAVAGSDRG